MRTRWHLTFFVVISCLAAGSVAGASTSSRALPAEVYVARQELGAKDLWPGFDPRETPLAIFDGERTWLFGHSQLPEGFHPLERSSGIAVFEGRHSAVAANSSAEIGGQRVATLMPAVLDAGARAAAGTAIHETFHVFERARHPSWGANEMDRFAYPDDDSELLALRRRESRALDRALAQASRQDIACWSRAALLLRRERFAATAPEATAYERALELFEGLAQYLEYRATGTPHPSDGIFAADGIRWRVYWSGHVLARLLDSFSEDWRQHLEAGSDKALDQLLAEALEEVPADESPCALSESEARAEALRAREDVAKLRDRRETRAREALDAPGWRLVLESPDSPLWPQGFDPLNLEHLGGGRILHTRMLKLGNELGTLEFLDHRALTEAAGDHPLFQGIRRAVILGIEAEPKISEEGGRVRIDAGSVKLEARGRLETEGKVLVLRLGAPAGS